SHEVDRNIAVHCPDRREAGERPALPRNCELGRNPQKPLATRREGRGVGGSVSQETWSGLGAGRSIGRQEDRMTRVISNLMLSVAVLLSARVVAAQTSPPTLVAADAKAEPAEVLDPVVVTATKTSVPVGETGSSVTVIDRQEIESRQVTDMLQILRNAPGLTVIQSGSRGSATSIFTRGGNADMNQVLIDGMKVNAGGGAFDFANLTTVGIGRAEVVRGPQSALYGAEIGRAHV